LQLTLAKSSIKTTLLAAKIFAELSTCIFKEILPVGVMSGEDGGLVSQFVIRITITKKEISFLIILLPTLTISEFQNSK
jgi:hypothetical protein